MIVRNESDVIIRCLASVIDVIDYWVIVDTGSTDDTIEKIQDYLSDIPGEIQQKPWKNFGHNRNEALLLAKGKADYLLFMDADDVLEFSGAKTFGALTKDCYRFWRGTKGFSYLKRQLVKADLPWRWIGPTHEYIDCFTPHTIDVLDGIYYSTKEGGASAKNLKEKFLRNIALLQDDLSDHPNNRRNMFYLAESYRDAGMPGDAIIHFQKRIQMGGWQEEVFWSYLQIALLLEKIGLSKSVIEQAFLDAHRYRKKRIEPVYYLAKLYNHQKEYDKAYQVIHYYQNLPKYPKDSLFNVEWIALYGLEMELCVAAYHTEKYEEADAVCQKMLAKKAVPKEVKTIIRQNRDFPRKKLLQSASSP